MIRHFLSVCALFVGFFCVTGCGGSSGPATYDSSDSAAQTQEEIDEAAAYDEQMRAQEAEGGYGSGS